MSKITQDKVDYLRTLTGMDIVQITNLYNEKYGTEKTTSYIASVMNYRNIPYKRIRKDKSIHKYSSEQDIFILEYFKQNSLKTFTYIFNDMYGTNLSQNALEVRHRYLKKFYHKDIDDIIQCCRNCKYAYSIKIFRDKEIYCECDGCCYQGEEVNCSEINEALDCGRYKPILNTYNVGITKPLTDLSLLTTDEEDNIADFLSFINRLIYRKTPTKNNNQNNNTTHITVTKDIAKEHLANVEQKRFLNFIEEELGKDVYGLLEKNYKVKGVNENG